MVPLSAPETITPSELIAKAFRIALCPETFWIKFPKRVNFLSREYFLTIWEFPLLDIIRSCRSETVLFGMKSKSSDGLLVIGESTVPKSRVLAQNYKIESYVFPAARSQRRTVVSCEDVITCGSAAWHLTAATVFVWPL